MQSKTVKHTRRMSAVEAAARAAAASLDPDPEHSSRVAALALSLFDALFLEHGLDGRARTLLAAAAILHDVGWAGGAGKGHHKRSRDMIRGLDIGLRGMDLELCALVARYHTKAEPDPERHGDFAKLGRADRRLVECLAGILRVCDGLDCSHRGQVKGVQARIDTRSAVIKTLPGGADAETARAAEKSSLLRKALGRKLVIE